MSRIVFVSPYSHRGVHSGARHRVESLCQELQKKGEEIICLSPWRPSASVEHIYYSIDGNLLKRLVINLLLTVKLFFLKPDVVFSECPLVPFSLGRYKVFHTIHDAKFVTRFGRQSSSLHMALHWLSSRIANRVVTVSASERERICQALHLPEHKVYVSYNGLSRIWLEPGTINSCSNKKFDVLYVSNFSPHKGHLDLLKALQGMSLKVGFVGADFGTLEECKSKAAEWGVDVTFMASLAERELVGVYDSARVFVFPSLLEGFGIPYIEARARGLYVVARDIPVFRELGAQCGGEVVDFNNADQVKQSIIRALSTPCELADMKGFSWEVIADQLIKDLNIG